MRCNRSPSIYNPLFPNHESYFAILAIVWGSWSTFPPPNEEFLLKVWQSPTQHKGLQNDTNECKGSGPSLSLSMELWQFEDESLTRVTIVGSEMCSGIFIGISHIQNADRWYLMLSLKCIFTFCKFKQMETYIESLKSESSRTKSKPGWEIEVTSYNCVKYVVGAILLSWQL